MIQSYSPSHADFIVEFHGEFSSFLKTRKSFIQGETLTVLRNLTIRSPKAYSTVQCGRGVEDNAELNSDFLYVNHSCEPNIAFDLSSTDPTEWHVRALKNIDAGSPVTFFYPSTEWEMDQAFECQCGTETCLGRIQGAKFLTTEQVNERGWVSPWILELMEERDA
ncbi:hypothetical protein C8F04DRAFT_1000763 [Mycena alexandri]|uniref:Post-SET domain-containing protein n=1 Tax=Mycena alexandri TaxID=1745969 RepID=A0AAD6X1Q7_9AGAR|nr:hypothetical protein C8F04DRAFT_1000763 [Mycena alexandri]